MNLYITTDLRRIVKENYRDIYRESEVIVLSDVLEKHNREGLDSNPTLNYLLFLDIRNIFLRLYKNEVDNKSIKNVIYCLNEINEINIKDIKKFLYNEKIIIHKFYLIDYHDDIDRSLYDFFDKVI